MLKYYILNLTKFLYLQKKKIYFEFDETLFHSHAISVSVEVTNIPNHSDYHNIEEIEGGGDPCQKLVLTSTDI